MPKRYRFPKRTLFDPEENVLAVALHNFISHDPNSEFVKMLKQKYGFKFQDEKMSLRENEIDSFVKNHGYLPSMESINKEEKVLGMSWNHFKVHPEHRDFAKKHANSLTYRQYKINEKAKQVVIFHKETGRFPSRLKEDEKKLGTFVMGVKHGDVVPQDVILKEYILSKVYIKPSGLPLGVIKSRNNTFIARIKCYGKQRHLGTFGTIEEAHAAVEKAKSLV